MIEQMVNHKMVSKLHLLVPYFHCYIQLHLYKNLHFQPILLSKLQYHHQVYHYLPVLLYKNHLQDLY